MKENKKICLFFGAKSI